MREILFRGKRVDNGEWVEGFVSIDGDNAVIHTKVAYYRVHSETVGQFTGLLDKNGKRIFEGDVLELGSAAFGFVSVSDGDGNPAKYRVTNSGCDFVLFRADIKLEWGRLSRVKELSWYCEIIGNIHDNPEIL